MQIYVKLNLKKKTLQFSNVTSNFHSSFFKLSWLFSSSVRLVKNLSRRQEGFIASANLQLIVGDSSSQGHSFRLRGKREDAGFQDDNVTSSRRAFSALIFLFLVFKSLNIRSQIQGTWRRGSSAPRREEKAQSVTLIFACERWTDRREQTEL